LDASHRGADERLDGEFVRAEVGVVGVHPLEDADVAVALALGALGRRAHKLAGAYHLAGAFWRYNVCTDRLQLSSSPLIPIRILIMAMR
jgi:hypothetical protein